MQPKLSYRKGHNIGGRYEVHQVLEGGMGAVYICYDHENREAIALKTFQDKYLTSPMARQRFIREASLWVQLQWHPNIVYANHVEELDGKLFIAIEYITGPEGVGGASLRHWIGTRYLTLERCLDFAFQISAGMSHVATRIANFVHRDLKPENVLISNNFFAKVTDFGLAKFSFLEPLDERALPEESAAETKSLFLTSENSFLGTLPYMPPELCAGRADLADSRSDIY